MIVSVDKNVIPLYFPFLLGFDTFNKNKLVVGNVATLLQRNEIEYVVTLVEKFEQIDLNWTKLKIISGINILNYENFIKRFFHSHFEKLLKTFKTCKASRSWKNTLNI